MSKVIKLDEFKRCNYNNKLISDMKNERENTNITINKDKVEIYEKDIFFDDDDFISKFYSKEM
ncbi:hypothetical protein CLRAG_33680 [Clostridium ragsdalei P11]|uniref:Uncharacterized protein n=1 Tax=Clostridium ragsdalei P11 TaxID=1353534 RepID=A0A1A6AKV9_9CLOT|nr:hypothetical protein [Clostridium ragsdalei]OBR90720.1 hypothetical protein CLRAG_33680 [Clostridium ragsdalei P11]